MVVAIAMHRSSNQVVDQRQTPITDQRITPNGKYLYLLNQGGGPDIPGTVVSITTSRGLAASPTATVGVGPIYFGIRPDGKRAYVSNQSDGTVTVINIQP